MNTILTQLAAAEKPAVPARPARRFNPVAALAAGSTLLAVPGGFGAVMGYFLILPPLLFLAGAWLLVGYHRALWWPARAPGKAFWRCSAAYNFLLAPCTMLWLASFADHSPRGTDAIVTASAMACALLWQLTAAFLSLRAARNPRCCRDAAEGAETPNRLERRPDGIEQAAVERV